VGPGSRKLRKLALSGGRGLEVHRYKKKQSLKNLGKPGHLVSRSIKRAIKENPLPLGTKLKSPGRDPHREEA